jgi:hypothetical protein
METVMSLISQEQYLALYAKTDMKAVRDYVAKNGIKAWQQVVKSQGMKLAKDATTQGITTGLGLNFIDLRAPSYLLDPVYTPILNSTPRWGKVNAGYGVQPMWKSITAFDATNVFPMVSEGNINAYSSFTEKNYSAPYVTLGSDDFVTYEGMSASEGFEDVLGTAKMAQLLRFRRNQERTYLGGASTLGANGNPLQLGTANTPVGSLTASGTNNPANLPTGSYAAAYVVGLSYRAATNPVNTPANGIVLQYTRTNADGSQDVINGGNGIASAASNVVGPTVTGTKNVQFVVTPKAGEWGYAWFVQVNTSTTFTPAAANAKLTGITTGPSVFIYTGQTQGTQAASAVTTDYSTNALDMDGILTIASNSNYSTNLPQASYPSSSSVTVINGTVVDLHGAGLTNGGLVGSVTEFDNMLFAIQQATLTSPTKIYLSTDQVNGFTKAFMVGATGSTAINFFFPNGGQGGDGLAVETHIAKYHNRFALSGGAFVDVIQHPYLPAGTILFDVDTLGEAYDHSRMGATRGVFVRRDTYGIEFAQNSRKIPFGVFSEEVLAVKTPNILGIIKGAGAFGATNVF